MVGRHHLHGSVFVYARLCSARRLSCMRGGPCASLNSWALVQYTSTVARVTYLCVLQVDYFAQLKVQTEGLDGFQPQFCSQEGLINPRPRSGEADVEHLPYEVAVGKMWLARECSSTMGTVGCDSDYADAGYVPDLVLVTNMDTSITIEEDGGLLLKQQAEKLANHEAEKAKRAELPQADQDHVLWSLFSDSMYYGTHAVHVADIKCMLAPASHSHEPGALCFLSCGNQSGYK